MPISTRSLSPKRVDESIGRRYSIPGPSYSDESIGRNGQPIPSSNRLPRRLNFLCSQCALDLEFTVLGGFFGRLAVLTCDDVGSVPSRPVVLRGRRFVLAMMFFCLSQQFRHRCYVKIADPSSGQPRCNLLQQPTVAVRIMERGKRSVTSMRRIATARPKAPKQVGLVRASMHVAAVKYFADFDAATEQVLSGGFNIRDGQVQALGRARRCCGDILAEDYRTSGAGRCELYSTPVVTSGEISVEPPSKLCVELLRPVYIGNRDDDHLKFHVDCTRILFRGWFIAADCTQRCHFVLLTHAHPDALFE